MKVFCLIFCILSLSPLHGGVIEESLKQIPVSDKLFMKEFIKVNLKWHQTAHVICFDNKPVCLASAWIKSPQRSHMDFLWVKGWGSFKKHEYLFPHPNFIFNSHVDEEDEGWQAIHLYVINKRALHKCFEKHLTIFQNVIGKDFSFDGFVGELEKGANLFDLVKEDEELLGILLGYGKESARLFKATMTNPAGFSKEAQGYGFIDIKTPKNCKLFPMTFMGNPENAEVKNLITEYENELKTFWKLYRRKDPLVLFFKCICN